MATGSIEISVRGKWIRVPSMEVGGKTIFVKGKWIRTAAVFDEEWLATELGIRIQGCHIAGSPARAGMVPAET